MAESYQRPGRNVTGITVLSAELTAKRIQLLTTVAPSVSRVAVFWREPAARDEAQRAASLLGVQCDFFAVPDQQALASALDAAVKAGAEAILVEPQPLMLTAGPQIAAFAATRRLPVISGNSGLPRTGALMSYGPRVPDNFRRAAYYVDRILKGAQPADLPVEQPREFDFVINLKTAQALGLTIPQQVLLQATEVIQ
jgi:putative ABC transport system substrate-binding protein